jgi:hypothetical protein
MKKTAIVLGLVLLLGQGGSLYAAQKSLKLTTYYPSPYGEYSKLQSRGACVGSTCAETDHADNKLVVKGGACVGTTCTAADTTAPNLKVKGDSAVTGNVTVSGKTSVNGTQGFVISQGTPSSPQDGQIWIP